MEKSKLMEQYEAKINQRVNWAANPIGYTKWLEAKAEAYDRLVSGEYTLKDMANIFQMYSVIDSDGYTRLFADQPFIKGNGWSSNFPEDEFPIPGVAKHTGDWATSLTLPDGFESDIPSKVKSKDIPSREDA